MKKTKLGAVGLAAVVFIFAVCNDGGIKSGGGDAVAYLKHFSDASVIEDDGSGTFTDDRDGKTYKKTKIGKQTWMAENLNYISPSGNSWCYELREDSCTKYGRLYDWATAMGLDASYNNKVWGGRDVASKKVCPNGWHLPSEQELEELMLNSCEIGNCDGLKSEYGWTSSNYYFDLYGFSALPGGIFADYEDSRRFEDVGYAGVWWTTQDSQDWLSVIGEGLFEIKSGSGAMSLHISGGGGTTIKRKADGVSVRCIRGN